MRRSPDAFLARARRADELALRSTTSAEPLAFAAEIYRAQALCAGRLGAFSGELERDAGALLEAARELIAILGARLDAAPTAAGLISHAREQRSADDPLGFVHRTLLRPWFEALKTHDDACGPPWIASRRASGDAAARFLHCAWCAAEQPVNRILCPACGETDPEQLPVFHSDTHVAVRIEACERCRRYLKSIDLSLDARPIPEVDDLASLSLDLWARERGFVRLEPGLAGI